MEIDAIAPGVTSVDALTPLGENRTRVIWSMDFRVRFGPLGWLMGKVLDSDLQGLTEAVRTSN